MTPDDTFNLDTLTAQQVLDAAAHHLFTMPRQSTFQGTKVCMYRAETGDKCVAGALIRDDEYNESMERISVHTLAKRGLLPARLAPHVDLLAALQALHDQDPIVAPEPIWDAGSGSLIKSRAIAAIAEIAADYGLAVPAIAKAEGSAND